MSNPVTLSVRCHTNCDCSFNLNAHKTLIDNWLSFRQTEIIQSSFGIHREASRPHYHYHLVVKTKSKPLASPLSTLKYDMEKHKMSFDLSTVFIQDKNMSIKNQIYIDHSINTLERFLQYPLKEGEIYDACNIDQEKLILQAKAEFLVIQTKRAKDQEKADIEAKRKFLLVQHLDKNAKPPYFHYDIYDLALSFYRKEPKRPILPNIFKEVDEWLYSNGHITNEDLIKQYRPKVDNNHLEILSFI